MTSITYTALPAFECYFEPKTIDEAVSLLAKHGKEAKLLAGGTDLINLQRNRIFSPKSIINITKISGLDYLKIEKDTLAMGALATLRAAELSPIIRKDYPLLFEAIHQMGSIQVRNMGTVVGNICRASPAADTAPPLLALEARIVILGPNGSRAVPLDQFFKGPGQTVLDPSEMVTEIKVAKPPRGSGTAFLKLTRAVVDLAKVNVAAMLTVNGGICQKARIALGGVAPVPIRALKAEAHLEGKKLDGARINEASSTVASEISSITDVRSTEEYRREMSEVLTRKVINVALERGMKS